MVNSNQAEGAWNKFTGDMKTTFSKSGLTDNDLEWGVKGQWDKLKGWAKEKLGDAQEQKDFHDRVDAYQKGLNDGKATESCGTSCGCSGKNAA